MDTLAPIVLFVYNRPDHTLNLLKSLGENDLADKSELIVYADGPSDKASDESITKINKVREIVKSVKWCKKLTVNESNNNQGLAGSIVNGVTNSIHQFGRVIVLEDDLILSKGFLQYMNKALNLYNNEEKVMHISGYVLPVKNKFPNTFFFHIPFSWGWATWEHAWNYYNEDVDELIQNLSLSKNFSKFNSIEGYDYMGDLLANKKNTHKTWLINWYASIFLQNGLCLTPGKSLTRNMGFDSSGSHCNKFYGSSFFHTQELSHNIDVSKIDISEYVNAEKEFSKIYKWLYKPSIFIKIKEKIKIICGK